MNYVHDLGYLSTKNFVLSSSSLLNIDEETVSWLILLAVLYKN